MPASQPVSELRRNLAAEVVAALRHEIISGELAPGQPLSEPALAKRFELSRVPVREALIELEREGLLQFEPTGRTRVRKLEEGDVHEIIEARAVLESAAARRVAVDWSGDDTAWVEANLVQQVQALSLSSLSSLDIALHQYVMQRACNSRLLRAWQTIRWQFEMHLARTHRLQETLGFHPRQITVDSHRHLLAALASGDPEFAALTMTNHITNCREWDAGSLSECADFVSNGRHRSGVQV